jgi:NAD(P)-dependent dehydrogenase (short-subunit alcohol dehydrogenase family)/rhamnose utilization protein RhaD (predicted bifunctional aldolase and dehydrogenase)
MDKALIDLIRISNVTGKDSSLVQGGGGNTSVKTADGRYMYIKASGTALKDMDDKHGWRKLRLDAVLSIIGDESLVKRKVSVRELEVVNRLLLACDDDVTDDARPSVESHLHAFLDRCVIHLHPLVVAAYASAKNGQREIEKLFAKENTPPLWVPYTDPGFALARRISKLVEIYQKKYGKKPKILFLQKHGVFISSRTANSALRLVRKVIKICSSKLKLKEPKTRSIHPPGKDNITACKLAVRKAVYDVTKQYMPVDYFPVDNVTDSFIRRKDASKLLATRALNPDEQIYANGSAMWLEICNATTIEAKLRDRIKRGQKPAAAFVVKGIGLFVAAEKKVAPLVAEITNGSLLVRMHAARFGGVLALTKREQEFVDNWESEAFRKKLVSGKEKGELKGRIAVVTGAGSGLGKSIAIGLAKAGAMVGIFDIDKEAAEQTASQIQNFQTLVVQSDVTDETGVKGAFETVVENWGGLDILVNAAGVAPAYPLVEMPVDKWRVALEVNLTGYFLCAREAAKIMIEQGMGGSIINLSSKSGLEASVNNTAYNATKAGEIHIARGWALELGEYGIRVNSIAPGNVFEGSKIWNPQYMRVCAKKYGIKPEEVIPYYVNKTALKREIKGRDVADSIVFLCSDRARTITGQVVVPDSGQVMVR